MTILRHMKTRSNWPVSFGVTSRNSVCLDYYSCSVCVTLSPPWHFVPPPPSPSPSTLLPLPRFLRVFIHSLGPSISSINLPDLCLPRSYGYKGPIFPRYHTYISSTPCHRCLLAHYLLVEHSYIVHYHYYLVYRVHLDYHIKFKHKVKGVSRPRLTHRQVKEGNFHLHPFHLHHVNCPTTLRLYLLDIHSTLITLINQIHHLQWLIS